MNSSGIYILVFIINIVIGDQSENDKPINIADDRSTYDFEYLKKDKLHMRINFKNMSAGVTHYILYYGTDTLIKNATIVPGRKEMQVPIELQLTEKSIEIKVKLYKKYMICVHRVIARGNLKENPKSSKKDACLKSKSSCTRDVDFEGQCTVISKKGSMVSFYCEWQNIAPKDFIHQWFQFSNGSFMLASPQTQSVKNKFTIQAESFDNNSSVNCRLSSLSVNGRNNDCMTKLYLMDDETSDKKGFPILRYSATKEFKFHCEKYLEKTQYVQIGMINTTSNKIKVYDGGSIIKLNKSHHDTILCCLIYKVKDDKYNIRHIIRSIENKKVLFYDKDHVEDSEANHVTLYLILAVMGVVLLLFGIFIYKKRCFIKKTERTGLGEEIEMDTYYATPNTVNYAELNLPPGRPNCFFEESPYAKIIGVLMPKTKK